MGWIFFVSTSKKKRCRKQVVGVGVGDGVVRFGRRTTTTRRRARKKSGEIETGKRRGRGSGEERVRRVVAWAAFFRERKGKDSRFCFIFFRRPRIFPLFYLNAHCVLLRETISRTLPLGKKSSSSSSVGPGGRKTLRAGERDGTVAPSGRDEDGDDGIAADAMGPRTGASSSSSAPKKQSNQFSRTRREKRMVAQALKRKRDAMKKSNKPTKGNANKSNGGNNGGISGDPPKLKPPTISSLTTNEIFGCEKCCFDREGCFECLKGPPVSTRYEPGKGIEWLEDIRRVHSIFRPEEWIRRR